MEFAVSREESEIMTDTQVMAALEPCPVSWCEDSRPHVFKVTATLCGVRCNECGTKTPGYWTESEAVAAWNLRIASSPAAEPVAWAYGPQGDPPTWFASTRWKASDIGKWTEYPLYAAPVPPPAGDASWTDSEIARRAQRIVEIANKYEGYDELALAKVPVTVLRAAAMIVNGKAFEPLVEKMRDTAGDAELRKALRDARDALLAVGNDYPGSSCQQWCTDKAREAWNALKPWTYCPSTHCERTHECRSINECSAERSTLATPPSQDQKGEEEA